MKQILTHWTNKSFKDKMLLGELEFRELTEKDVAKGFSKQISNSFKPVGFWLSVNGSWENWIKGNWDSWMEGKVCLRAILSEDINLFIIESKEQFLNEFKNLTGKDYEEMNITERWDMTKFHLKLAEKYDGVWLKSAPFYRHRLDLDFPYFYFWDCESICVWNKNKIKFIENNTFPLPKGMGIQ